MNNNNNNNNNNKLFIVLNQKEFRSICITMSPFQKKQSRLQLQSNTKPNQPRIMLIKNAVENKLLIVVYVRKYRTYTMAIMFPHGCYYTCAVTTEAMISYINSDSVDEWLFL